MCAVDARRKTVQFKPAASRLPPLEGAEPVPGWRDLLQLRFDKVLVATGGRAKRSGMRGLEAAGRATTLQYVLRSQEDVSKWLDGHGVY